MVWVDNSNNEEIPENIVFPNQKYYMIMLNRTQNGERLFGAWNFPIGYNIHKYATKFETMEDVNTWIKSYGSGFKYKIIEVEHSYKIKDI